MQAHILEPSHPHPQPTAGTRSGAEVTPVGTFAAGQAEQSSFHVVTDAGVGTFASGLAADLPSATR